MSNVRTYRQAGATLLELVMGLLVASVLTMSAAPSFSHLLSSRDIVPVTSDLLASINLARSAAMTRQSRVAVAARDGHWGQGWEVFVDANDNGVLDSDEILIRSSSLEARGLAIAAHFGASYSGTAISYDAIGRPQRPGSHGLLLGRLVLTQGSEARSLCFASLRVRVTKGSTCS